MKVGVIFFHKNVNLIYQKRWIDKCAESIKNQSFKNFQIYEINYGGDGNILIENSKFYNLEKINYADAMNFIISECFDDGCDYVFNTNLDDYYREDRIEKQLNYLERGYDIVSSDFCYIDNDDNITHHMLMSRKSDIKMNLNFNNNIIAHPSIGISKKFWSDVENRYDINKTPAEDMDLWKRSINKGYKFYIINEVLLYYRIHQNQVSKK
jgi:hypothetical protein